MRPPLPNPQLWSNMDSSLRDQLRNYYLTHPNEFMELQTAVAAATQHLAAGSSNAQHLSGDPSSSSQQPFLGNAFGQLPTGFESQPINLVATAQYLSGDPSSSSQQLGNHEDNTGFQATTHHLGDPSSQQQFGLPGFQSQENAAAQTAGSYSFAGNTGFQATTHHLGDPSSQQQFGLDWFFPGFLSQENPATQLLTAGSEQVSAGTFQLPTSSSIQDPAAQGDTSGSGPHRRGGNASKTRFSPYASGSSSMGAAVPPPQPQLTSSAVVLMVLPMEINQDIVEVLNNYIRQSTVIVCGQGWVREPTFEFEGATMTRRGEFKIVSVQGCKLLSPLGQLGELELTMTVTNSKNRGASGGIHGGRIVNGTASRRGNLFLIVF